MKRRNRPVYEAVLYHDSEGEAADRERELGYFPSVDEATRAVNEARDPATGWHTGGIRYGFLWERTADAPEYFESDDRETPWFVGTDGKADR